MILTFPSLHGVNDMQHPVRLAADRIAELRIEIQHGIMTVAEIITAGEIQWSGPAEENAQTAASVNASDHIIYPGGKGAGINLGAAERDIVGDRTAPGLAAIARLIDQRNFPVVITAENRDQIILNDCR